MRDFPQDRIRCGNAQAVDPNGDYILYWMVAHRRVNWNFGLQRALDWSRELRKPLLIVESLSCDYPWASDRFHRFILDGMLENDRKCRKKGIEYRAYLEPSRGAGDGLIDALASHAAVVVTDDYPAFFLSRMLRRVTKRLPKKCELIDSNGIFPMAGTEKCFARAYDFRRFLQKNLRPHLNVLPDADPMPSSETVGSV